MTMKDQALLGFCFRFALAIGFVGTMGLSALGADKDLYSTRSLPAADPLLFQTPKALPTVYETLTDADYEQRVTQLSLPKDWDVEKAKQLPLTTVEIMHLSEGGRAQGAGIKLGDTILTLNGKPLRYHWDILRESRTGEKLVCQVQSRSCERREVEVPAGEADMRGRTIWNASVAWARAARRDPNVEPFIRVATAAALRGDAELVLSAVSRMQKLKSDDKACQYIAAALASEAYYDLHRFDEAVTFGAIAIESANDEDRPIFVRRSMIGAAASFKIPYYLMLAETYGGDVNQNLISAMRTAAQEWNSFPDRLHPNPLSELGSYDYADKSDLLNKFFQNSAPDTARVIKELNANGSVVMQAPSAHYDLAAIGPADANVDASIEFSFERTDNEPTAFGRTFNFGIYTGDRRVGKSSELIKVTLFTDDRLEVGRYTRKDYLISWKAPAAKHYHGRIIVLGQRCEVIVEGQRAFYGPVPLEEQHRQCGLLLQAVGVKATIHKLTWRTAPARTKP